MNNEHTPILQKEFKKESNHCLNSEPIYESLAAKFSKAFCNRDFIVLEDLLTENFEHSFFGNKYDFLQKFKITVDRYNNYKGDFTIKSEKGTCTGCNKGCEGFLFTYCINGKPTTNFIKLLPKEVEDGKLDIYSCQALDVPGYPKPEWDEK